MQRSHPRPPRGYTLLELAVLVVVLALLAGMILPMFGRTRTTRCGTTTSSHLRGIHSGMVLYAQGNKDRYPGLNADGFRATTALPAAPGIYGTASTDGYDPAYRMAVLLRGNYFSPEYAISPMEPNTSGKSATQANANANITSANFSYAMLRLADSGMTGRRNEWTATNNSRAAVMSDRNLAGVAGKGAWSIYVTPGDGWRGTVVYNDNHAMFETSNFITSAYSHGNVTRGLTGNAATVKESTFDKSDDLFADDKDAAGEHGNDAAMVHQDDRTYVNQK